jgi:hypothetical protein
MEPIDPQELTTVTGGFAFLAALPGILSGVTGLVNAFKGSGSSPQTAQAPQQPVATPPTPPAGAAPTTASPTQMASGGPSPGTGGGDPMGMLSSVTNIINIGRLS